MVLRVGGQGEGREVRDARMVSTYQGLKRPVKFVGTLQSTIYGRKINMQS